ncbi:MAG: sulfide/dihydroorotate dehydrogenase-like FAD/NAD-binding protein, partial [Candidatus Omnitrophica bacterium]|nr:sulfide/dihydroorotate dehydrogenase-like FAD/NAD-binding protein [Candidatus Omnitrophota bacterium]
MVDATGMCGGCRVTIGDSVKFACVDGPEFDARLVDWDELEKRNRTYEVKEKHICNLYKE